jgi:hypothetical protein
VRTLAGSIARRLDAPVDGASLAVFRAGFGLLMSAAMIRALARGFVRTLYVEPAFHFTWAGFGWVRPWPGVGMYLHFAALAGLALGIATGIGYRLCATAFFLGFAFVELCDKTGYLNHYYLITLLAALLALGPRARMTNTVPGWYLLALRFQIGIVYVFAGLAKLNADWLLRAQPLRIWLAARADLPVIGPLVVPPAAAYAASWAGALFDLTIVPLLLIRRTRAAGFALVIGFHLFTWLLFPIGIFPWLMILSATLFFPADWPRSFCATAAAPAAERSRTPRAVAAIVALHCAVQIAVPLWRQIAHPDAGWTWQGFNFAWKVMLAEKAGHVSLTVYDPRSGRERRVPVERYLTPMQAAALPQDPDMIRNLARHIAETERQAGGPALQVRADAVASLNGRPSAPLIDPTIDLAADELRPGWILPAPPP